MKRCTLRLVCLSILMLTIFAGTNALFAATMQCKEHENHYNEVTFNQLDQTNAEITLLKHNIVYKVSLTGKLANFDVYENSVVNNQTGKLVFLFNPNTKEAIYSELRVGFGGHIKDNGEDELICR